jgi:hypothetical protein
MSELLAALQECIDIAAWLLVGFAVLGLIGVFVGGVFEALTGHE